LWLKPQLASHVQPNLFPPGRSAMFRTASTAVILALHFWAGDASNSAAHRSSKPHILFIMVDEMDGRILDDETPQFKPPMPHLRQLMKKGTYFPNAYSNSPLCVPARTSMLAGRYNSDIKVWDNFIGIANVNGDNSNLDKRCVDAFSRSECREFAAEQKINGTFIDVLADHGYEITLWGKVHAGAGLDRFSHKISNDPFTGTGPVRESAKAWSRLSGVVSKRQNPTLWMRRPNDVPMPAEGFYDYPTAEECAKLIRQGIFKKATPQFLYCSFSVPHPPYQTNGTYWNAVGSLGKHAVPRLVPRDKLHPADAYAAKAKQFWHMDECDAKDIEHFRRVYFSMCVESDKLVGNILSAFYNSGVKNAYVMFVSDHGEHNLENRQWQKSSMKEASARIPLIIAGPGLPKGQRINGLTSLHDVYPTLLDMAGAKSRVPQSKLAGESVLPMARGHERKRNYVVSEYHDSYSRTGAFMIRQGHLKLIVHAPLYHGGKPWPAQLFDVKEDPWELTDLANKKPGEVQRLENMLRKEFDVEAVDKHKKDYDRRMFLTYVYRRYSGPAGCHKTMDIAFPGFDEEDAKSIEQWIGKPCCKVAEGRKNRKAKYHSLQCPSRKMVKSK